MKKPAHISLQKVDRNIPSQPRDGMRLKVEPTMKINLFYFLILIIFGSCTAQKNYNPARRFSPQELQKDYEVFRNVLEESHPSLYWYTPKDSVDYFFELGASRLKDSLLEYQFRNILSYVVAQ